MPPLSAYTPFESLLFFQSLAALDTRPANFASISDLLRNNSFIRQNTAFDAERLSPEALEDLYTTLIRDGLDSAGSISPPEPNGRHADSPGSNSKKRKISSPRPEGLVDKGMSHVSIVPDLASHLYARYKELVTREIRSEERRYKEIKDEIERLQNEERDVLPEVVPASMPVPGPAAKPATPEVKQQFAPEPMDVDVEEEKPVQQPPKEVNIPPVLPVPATEIGRPATKPQRQESGVLQQPEQPAKLAPQPIPAPTAQQLQNPPVLPIAQPQQEQPKKAQQQPPKQPPKQQQQPQSQLQQPPSHPQPGVPMATGGPPQPQLVNGKSPLSTQPAPGIVPQNIPVNQVATKVQPVQPQTSPAASTPVPPPAPAPSIGAVPTFTATPSQAPQNITKPVPSLTPAPTAKPAGKQGPPPTVPTPTPQRLPPQPSFQQWSLNQPQTPTPQPPSSTYPKPQPPNYTAPGKPLQSPLPQPTPKPEPARADQGPATTAVPSTPVPPSVPLQSPAPSGFVTPVGVAQALLLSELRGARGPRLSIDTTGSSTPWKKTPRPSIPRSPGSPVRPGPRDVSPISDRAASPIEALGTAPEETRTRRKKRRAPEEKARRPSREPSLPPNDMETKGQPRMKTEKPPVSAGKKRDRSTTSSRSRGRSILSRDEESTADLGFVSHKKIKNELPSTPVGVPETSEAEHRATGSRKVATAAPQTEERPGRGRPKRKRGTSEALEPAEPLQSELSRLDPTQSTSFVLCARNFPRTGAPIMNDVTTHKHASIFAKPLAERDAPGYRDLIYRPQDLKSIKSSIHQGSRAVAAATEAANTPVADGESPAPNASSKSAVLMLQKTEDIIPPKGIVNSAQLEKELIRMFANAVMFNPIPERGFGPAFPMISEGGSRESTQVPELDEGGIINDTQEMFEDVEQAVTRWRAAERTADELATKSILSLRRGSASDFNTDSADEVKGS